MAENPFFGKQGAPGLVLVQERRENFVDLLEVALRLSPSGMCRLLAEVLAVHEDCMCLQRAV
jgi:hypothetical protein